MFKKIAPKTLLLLSLSIVILIGIASIHDVNATTYYVSTSGSDSGSGRSPDEAWQTIDRVNRGNYNAGDRILFKGGQRFTGSMLFTPSNSRGTETSPVEISSYDQGRAVIIAPSNRSGFLARNVAGFIIHNINFEGATTAPETKGIEFIINTPQTLSGIFINDVEISRTMYSIDIETQEKDIRPKYRNISLSNLNIHDNGMGPMMFGHGLVPGVLDDDYALQDVTVVGCRFYNNSGEGVANTGGGFFMINVRNVIFLDNKIYNNGGNSPPPTSEYENGVFGAVFYDVKDAAIAYNEIRGQKYTIGNETDNGGLDAWGNGIYILGNHIFGNRGWGVNLAGAPVTGDPYGNWPSENITLAYNIIFDNGQKPEGGDIFAPTSWAQVYIWGKIKNIIVAHNVIMQQTYHRVEDSEKNQGLITVLNMRIDEPMATKIYNNILIAPTDQPNYKSFLFFSDTERPEDMVGTEIINNAYIEGTSENKVIWGGNLYTDVSRWSQETGMERLKGQFMGIQAGTDVMCDIRRRGIITGERYQYTAFKLRPGSPLIDRAYNSEAINFSEVYDFYYNSLTTPLDVGSHEFILDWDSCS